MSQSADCGVPHSDSLAKYAAYPEGAYGVWPGDFALFHAHYAYALTRGFDLGLKAYYRNEQQRYVYG